MNDSLPDFMPRRIALSGPLGAGKTAVAKLLREEFNYSPAAFATALREDASAHFGIPLEQLCDPATKEEWRWLLQLYGTEICRRLDVDWWVNRFKSRYRLAEDTDQLLVVDDLRFLNELTMLSSNGFAIIRIQPSLERTWEFLTKIKKVDPDKARERLRHESETALSNVEWRTVMDGNQAPTEIFLDIVAHFARGEELKAAA